MIIPKTSSTWLSEISNVPAAPPPPGMYSTFSKPSNQETVFRSIVVFCFVLSMLAVGIRMWTKTRLIRKVVLEDWICCLALASFGAYCVVTLHMMKKRKSGFHQWNIRWGDIPYLLYYFRIIMAIYSVVIFLIKFSILLQYLRVFLPLKQHNAMFWTCHALIWLNLVLYLLFLFFTIFSCKPINKYWNPFISGNCLNTFAINVISPLINTTSDIVIVILPQPIIWNLQISFKKKIGLSTIILVGVLACVSSALRANYVIKILHTDDGTYSMFMIGLFSLFEIAFGFLAACLPVTPKFFESFRNLHIWSSLNSSFHSIIHSKTDSRIFGAQSGKSKAAKLGDGSNRFHAALTDFNSLPNEIEPATENKNGEITQDNRQIMRTVHIATTHEVNTASNKPDFDNQASGISYGYR